MEQALTDFKYAIHIKWEDGTESVYLALNLQDAEQLVFGFYDIHTYAGFEFEEI
jgi:hypothetical protein